MEPEPLGATSQNAVDLVEAGRDTFRYETFGSEAHFGDTLRLHQAIAGASNGGVGDGVSPATALAVGLKVDVQALPESLQQELAAGNVDLNDPATTLALLRLDAVVGVQGFFDASDRIESLGIRCALCHSTVDDSFAPGIGNRLDGWPNRDLDVGVILSLSPGLSAVGAGLGVDEDTLRTVLESWGPGKFDAHVFLDGVALTPNGDPGATLIPSAFGLLGVNLATYTGWGSMTYWNAFVANIEMGGSGTFYDPRLADSTVFPLAAAGGFGDTRAAEDRVTEKLAALQFYQLALPVPRPPAGSFDAAAASRGADLFNGAATCATCHVPPLFTEPGYNLHTASEIGIDDFHSSRSPDGRCLLPDQLREPPPGPALARLFAPGLSGAARARDALSRRIDGSTHQVV